VLHDPYSFGFGFRRGQVPFPSSHRDGADDASRVELDDLKLAAPPDVPKSRVWNRDIPQADGSGDEKFR
jgi:hypothetical protein